MTPETLRKAFFAALLLQLVILLLVPLQHARSLLTGRQVELQVEPVDPYSFMKGYYVTLSYRICRPERIASGLPDLYDGQTVYTVVREGANGLWVPVSLHLEPPADLPAGQLFLKGRKKGWRGISYGIEEYSISESKRREVDQALRKSVDKARVRVMVDADGNAALDSLEIDGVRY
ncbi:MAG TPA: GDYXXLXY domain-containing protein [Candidatus Ozemobacteraceae bacterium]|nr:GDYXXLXY domain-containing protein [Candidatus Ozemobacteraceae bacterium]